MSTKQAPGKFDCYANALPDEPLFVLLARDPTFELFVTAWANMRQLAINCGERPESDRVLVDEAMLTAQHGAMWRKANNGKWRTNKVEN